MYDAPTPTLKTTLVLSQPAVAKNFPSGENCMCLTKAECGDRSYLTPSSASFEIKMPIFDRADTGRSSVLLRSGAFCPGPGDVVRLRKGFGGSSFPFPPNTEEDWGLSRIGLENAATGPERNGVSPDIALCSLMAFFSVPQSRCPTGGAVESIETSVSDLWTGSGEAGFGCGTIGIWSRERGGSLILVAVVASDARLCKGLLSSSPLSAAVLVGLPPFSGSFFCC